MIELLSKTYSNPEKKSMLIFAFNAIVLTEKEMVKIFPRLMALTGSQKKEPKVFMQLNLDKAAQL